MEGYTVIHSTPTLETYLSLRKATGLTFKNPQAATTGLANTIFAVQISPSSSPDNVVGMGRIMGDRGCFFHLVDMAVHPEHQGRGVGKMITKELKERMDKNVPETRTVLLFADGKANELYKQYGFVETSTTSPFLSKGMALRY